MAAFFARIELAGRAVERERCERSLDALGRLGADGSRLQLLPGAALGHRHWWTTPEEVGERQPIERSGLHVLFDGRLDDRAALAEGSAEPADRLSDAALVLAGFRRWGRDLPSRLVGPFAFLVWDERRRLAFAARDRLGDRRLVYRFGGGALSIATHERALLADPETSAEPDERTAARYFAYRAPSLHETWYREIRELPPGHCLTAGEEGVSVWRYGDVRGVAWTPRDEQEAAERFREVLGEAVRCRLRTAVPDRRPAVLMSGGLDSTSVVALAAGAGAARPIPVSWTFDELVACDERRYSEPVVRALGLGPRTVVGDASSPLADPERLAGTPEQPGRDLYDALLRDALREARAAGAGCALTGHHANQLWEGGDLWLRDLLARRRLGEAAMRLGRVMRSEDDGSRAPARRALAAVARAAGWRGRAERVPPWLTPYARELVSRSPSEARWRDQQRGWWGPLRPYWTVEAARLRLLGAEAGVEVRMPYRDRRVIELVLGLPADLLDGPRAPRRLHRAAMRGALPEAVRRRRRPTNIYLWAERSLLGADRKRFFALLDEGERHWSRFVDRNRLLGDLRDSPRSATVHLAWRCIGFSLWSLRSSW